MVDLRQVLVILACQTTASAFQTNGSRGSFAKTAFRQPTSMALHKRTLVLEQEMVAEPKSYDPLHLSLPEEDRPRKGLANLLLPTALMTLAPGASALAAQPLSPVMDPKKFQPVCPASDAFYQVLKGGVTTAVGTENVIEYGPLIAGGLLRVRLELCIVESFVNEAVIPFIKENGLQWVLPLHETTETFLAGTVFALASTFILVGSSKLLSVIATYSDFFVGAPSRAIGGFVNDRARGKPVILDVGIGPLKTRVMGPPEEFDENGKIIEPKGNLMYLINPITLVLVFASGIVYYTGIILGFIRDVLEALDIFIGRYLVIWATGYVGIKFLHYKVFPDFPELPDLSSMM